MKLERAPIGGFKTLLGTNAVGLNAAWLRPAVTEGWWRLMRLSAQITASAVAGNRFSGLVIWSTTNVPTRVVDGTAAQTAGQDVTHLWTPGGVPASVGLFRMRGGFDELVLGAGENLTVQIVSGADAGDTITAVVGVFQKIGETYT